MGGKALHSSRLKRLSCGTQITSKQLRDDLMTMLIAGHETTAAVLTWTLHCINDRPHILRRMQKEVRPLTWHMGRTNKMSTRGNRLGSLVDHTPSLRRICTMASESDAEVLIEL